VTLLEATHRESQAQANRSVNLAMVIRNWLFGWYIVEYEQRGEDRATYGKQTLKRLSETLKASLGRGFSPDSLELMRRFYQAYIGGAWISETVSRNLDVEKSETLSRILALTASNPQNPDFSCVFQLPVISEKGQTVSGQFPLSWSHYVNLLTIDDQDERSFYEIETSQNNWGVRELKRQIDSSLYQRLALSRDRDEVRRLATEGQVVAKAADLIKNPLVLEFLDLEEKASYSERDLETAIIDKLQSFLLELGKGFLFEARQRRFTFDDDHYYVDLVLYNRLLRCYVLLDLKIGKLDHGDLGQMQMYVNYFDRHVKLDDELPTVGIVLCAHNNQAMVELTLPKDANIFASKYQLYLPSKEELKRELEKIEAEIDEFGLEAGE
jgi:predicted nuclease of restriction endonuclease-like (RecB) superfamily